MFYLSSAEDPRYNDSVCYQRFFCKIEFGVIKKLDMDTSKALITDTQQGDSNKYPKRMFFC